MTKKEQEEMEKEAEELKKQIISQIEESVDKRVNFVVIQDGMIASIIADTVTFGALLGVLAINHFKFDDSTLGAWMLGIMFFILMLNKGLGRMKKIKGKRQLAEFLKSLA